MHAQVLVPLCGEREAGPTPVQFQHSFEGVDLIAAAVAPTGL
jgi:hypothetical protein